MGFGYKTTWLAVRDRSSQDVADALQLADRERTSWEVGTERAYESGVYVARPVDSWTLAHGRRDLAPLPYSATDPGFPAWFTTLSVRLGEVQFFVNERGWACHGWAQAHDGTIIRAFATNDGAVPLFIGDVTPVEHEIGKGIKTWGHDWRNWQEDDWDAWNAAAPNERDVLQVAARWSVDPRAVDNAQAGSEGIYGMPVQQV